MNSANNVFFNNTDVNPSSVTKLYVRLTTSRLLLYAPIAVTGIPLPWLLIGWLFGIADFATFISCLLAFAVSWAIFFFVGFFVIGMESFEKDHLACVVLRKDTTLIKLQSDALKEHEAHSMLATFAEQINEHRKTPIQRSSWHG